MTEQDFLSHMRAMRMICEAIAKMDLDGVLHMIDKSAPPSDALGQWKQGTIKEHALALKQAQERIRKTIKGGSIIVTDGGLPS